MFSYLDLEKKPDNLLMPFPEKMYLSWKSNNIGVLIQPTLKGSELINKYYSNKYNTNITLVAPVGKLSEYDIFFKTIYSYNNINTDIRHAFIFDLGKSHARTIIYAKENNSIGLIDLESTCDTSLRFSYDEIFFNIKDMNVYTLTMGYQADRVSCHTYSLVMALRATAFDPDRKKYQIPNLLAKVATDAKRNPLYKRVFQIKQLDDLLLLPAQCHGFVEQHRSLVNPTKTRKGKSLDEIILRYNVTALDPSSCEKVTKKYNDYIRIKSLKFLNIMLIQFYLIEIQKFDKFLLKEQDEINFIKQAKVFLKQNCSLQKTLEKVDLHDFSEKFIKNVSEKMRATCAIKKILGDESEHFLKLFSETLQRENTAKTLNLILDLVLNDDITLSMAIELHKHLIKNIEITSVIPMKIFSQHLNKYDDEKGIFRKIFLSSSSIVHRLKKLADIHNALGENDIMASSIELSLALEEKPNQIISFLSIFKNPTSFKKIPLSKTEELISRLGFDVIKKAT